MRDYAIVSPHFWRGETGRSIRGRRPTQILALYLLTCPSSNMLGMYYLPICTITHETGLTDEEVVQGFMDLAKFSPTHQYSPVDNFQNQSINEAPSKPLQSPFQGPPKPLLRGIEGVSEGLTRSFAVYDLPSEYVFLPKMLAYQVGESLKPGDNRIKWIKKELKKLQKCPFYPLFMELYAEKFQLNQTVYKPVRKSPKKPLQRPLQAPSKPLRSQDQDQDQEQDKNKEKEPPPAPLLQSGVQDEVEGGVDNSATLSDKTAKIQAAQRIVQVLNERGEKNYPIEVGGKIPPGIAHIASLLDFYTESDLTLMVKRKCREWGVSDEKKAWLKISTLFDPIKCGDYVAGK